MILHVAMGVTSVLVAGLRSRLGASYVLLGLVADRAIRPLATPALFLEYEDVLKHPEQLLAIGMSVAEIDRCLNGFADAVQPIEIHYNWRPRLPDPNDELVFEAAINGRATAVITHNIRDFTQAGLSFGIEALAPAEALKRIRR